MNEQKNLLIVVGEWWQARREQISSESVSERHGRLRRLLRWLVPNGGTLLLIVALILTQRVWAKPMFAPSAQTAPSATTVNYQGRLADSAGNPLSGTYTVSFSLWDAASGGNLVWGPENHTAVSVSNGLFSVGLGSQTNGGIPTAVWNGDRYLQITVNGEDLSPRELIRSVPLAGMALTVPDGAIDAAQVADGAITSVHLASSSVTNAKIANGSVTANKLGPTAAGRWVMWDAPKVIVYKTDVASIGQTALDISSHVPAAAQVAYIKMYLKATEPGATCRIRPYLSDTTHSPLEVNAQVSEEYNSGSGLIALHNSKIEYECTIDSGKLFRRVAIQLWGYYEPSH